jgi:hypothetical protein
VQVKINRPPSCPPLCSHQVALLTLVHAHTRCGLNPRVLESDLSPPPRRGRAPRQAGLTLPWLEPVVLCGGTDVMSCLPQGLNRVPATLLVVTRTKRAMPFIAWARRGPIPLYACAAARVVCIGRYTWCTAVTGCEQFGSPPQQVGRCK